MTQSDIPEDILRLLRQVKGKRARIVIDHILAHGQITTEELETQYGYKHPPRAARDVREQGIPLETVSVKNAAGQTIAAYRFGDFSQLDKGKLGGRQLIPKTIRQTLLDTHQKRCHICLETYDTTHLQVDHRVPYEIAGDIITDQMQADQFMLLCGSCNRAKSWSCEHCPNWTDAQDETLCRTCYWAYPSHYKHIALRAIRRVDVVWTEDELKSYERLQTQAVIHGDSLPTFVKAIIAKYLADHK